MENTSLKFKTKQEIVNAIEVLTELYKITPTAASLNAAKSDKIKELIAKL